MTRRMTNAELAELIRAYVGLEDVSVYDQLAMIDEINRARESERNLKRRIRELELQLKTKTEVSCSDRRCPGCDDCRTGPDYR